MLISVALIIVFNVNWREKEVRDYNKAVCPGCSVLSRASAKSTMFLSKQLLINISLSCAFSFLDLEPN